MIEPVPCSRYLLFCLYLIDSSLLDRISIHILEPVSVFSADCSKFKTIFFIFLISLSFFSFLFIHLKQFFVQFDVHHLHDEPNGFFFNHFFDSRSVDIFSSFHLEVKFAEVVSVSDTVQYLIFGRETVFYVPSGYFAHLKFHDLLKVDVAEVIHYPFYFDVVDVDARSHIQIMYYFVGH